MEAYHKMPYLSQQTFTDKKPMPHRSYMLSHRINKSLIALDLLSLNLLSVWFVQKLLTDSPVLFAIMALQTISWVVITVYMNYYRSFYSRESVQIYLHTSKAIVYFSLLSYILFFAVFNIRIEAARDESIFQVSVYLGSFALYLYVSRLLLLAYRRTQRGVRDLTSRIIFIGCSDSLAHVMEDMTRGRIKEYRAAGYYAPEPYTAPSIPYLGDYNALEDLQDDGRYIAHEILVCLTAMQEDDRVKDFVSRAENLMLRVNYLPAYYEISRPVVMKQIGRFPVLTLREEPLGIEWNAIIKNIFDIAFALVVFFGVLIWLIPIIAILIRLESRGPVFFIQKRSGHGNFVFNCIKFRTMRVNDEANSRQATKGDRRITRVGAFLRKTSIDELPQFINVLKGEMSVVGPRPHMLSQTEDFSKIIDNYMVRHFIKPGVTGWAQVTGYRGEIHTESDIRNRVAADIWYMENWSFILDLKIIFLTVWKAFTGDSKAY